MDNFRTEAQREFANRRASEHNGVALKRAGVAAIFLTAAIAAGKFAYNDSEKVSHVWENGTENCQPVTDYRFIRDLGRTMICDDDKLVKPQSFASDWGGLAAGGSAIFGLIGLGFGAAGGTRALRAVQHKSGDLVRFYPPHLEFK